jgi:hypothetical protein
MIPIHVHEKDAELLVLKPAFEFVVRSNGANKIHMVVETFPGRERSGFYDMDFRQHRIAVRELATEVVGERLSI